VDGFGYLKAMTKKTDITLPKLGESIVEATIVKWFKKEGDYVNLDEPLLEVSTDKINSEIPSPVAGLLAKIAAHPDDLVKVGDVLGVISEEDEKSTEKPKQTPTENAFFSPAVLRLAKEHHISISELEKIHGTGTEGRVTKKDVENYLSSKKTSAPKEGDVEKVKMTPLRKAIAETMVRSFYEAPHASLVTEVDVSKVMQEIQSQKEAFAQKHGVKLSITTVMAYVLCRALEKYPYLNASLEDDHIVLKHYKNLGMAVSVEHGVVVPVIKHCEKKDIVQIAKSIADLASKARDGQLSHEEVEGGTITLTNFGMTGTMIGIPIIRHPEVAILGMGAVHRKVVALDDTTTAIRKCMNLSLTFDHRVIDGMYGCAFLAEIKQMLETPSFFSQNTH
jgi:2-oxoglutarate dehydrogenase E2 component (dihydrolipoamide succinyltransferase)